MKFLPPGEDVVFIANDWHTALLPCYLKAIYQPNGIYKSAKVSTQFNYVRHYFFYEFLSDAIP